MTPPLHRRHADVRADQPAHEPREELTGTALRLTVHLADGEQYRHRPVYTEIVHQAHRAGLAGAAVFRGMEGFGRNSRSVHTSRLLDVADDLPLLVVLVDTPERVRAFLPTLRAISPHSLATLEEVEVVDPAGPPAGAEGQS
ncbi:DUF190 domain-containing protein [Streptacidiphilus carbonis]|jgi:uncharacterized protein|uniref:DUF190 domain-containing protein n=1 Tax=Streptacidiphilus carbonis TaxID=105422 RepID=UPI000A06F844|nr:DUF190 domain-containing protein [Streptacidiphilus carbonis]